MPELMPVTVSCTSSAATILQKASVLAKKLNLSLCDFGKCTSKYILVFTDDRLELRSNPDMGQGGIPSPLFVDFIQGSNGYRHARNCTIKQPLARAVGIRSGFRPDIFDATAGLGGDGFVLACLGCKVTLCERSPILASLLQDGIERAIETQNASSEIVANQMTLLFGDSRINLASLPKTPHTVYLDPMYPHSKKSALNKIEMRIIRELVGDDDDGKTLLECALDHAENRVVVKRPKAAVQLGDRTPSHTIEMKNSRFDVYLLNRG